MVAIGLLYLALEDFILADFSWASRKTSDRSSRAVGRVLTGIQVSQSTRQPN